MLKLQVSTVALASLAGLWLVPAVLADTVTLPTSSFSSYSSFEQYWNYNYPWGDTHNGAARMVASSSDHDHVSLSGNVLTLTANPYSGDSDSSIKYHSGTVYAKPQVEVGSSAVGYQLDAEFIAPTARGTWPAFWLTAVSGWPPESDIAEWKGTDVINFNTFNTSSAVSTKTATWPQDGNYHAVRAVLRTISGNTRDIRIQYYLDNTLQATHVAANFYDKAMYL
ncbi:hypothetical protein OE88DRAFT_1736577 [Heliocybe sulcata]|uniref:GH16 domain-containing protein n=1 Tax=Heliocybe sulcata TaxID=5364 RepID=A0A5C3N716_9AGAM|nr:hypothetical protein OE88DRAFT_1736577 [Heliocybe sulcata]